MGKVVEFDIYKGQYQLALTAEARGGQGCWDWNHKRVRKEYPELVTFLNLLGFTNKSRDFYAQGLGYRLKPRNKSEAEYLRKFYTDIANRINNIFSI